MNCQTFEITKTRLASNIFRHIRIKSYGFFWMIVVAVESIKQYGFLW